jgi:predicted nucleic acid-binding Zn ribbon protein
MRCECGWSGEVKRAMRDVDAVPCPKCGRALVVVIAPVARVWKGGKP